jgi:hypothetical protein
MANVDVFAIPHSDLSPFLFADIGVEGNGNTLSVLSALARMGMDPWQEGGRLAGLSRRAATEAVATLITLIPDSPWPPSDAAIIAARLVALLPNEAKTPPIPAMEPSRQAAMQFDGQWGILFAVVAMIFAGLALNRAGLLGEAPVSPPASYAAASPPKPPGPAESIPIAAGQ